MNHRIIFPIAMILLAILVVESLPLFAHEGHGKGEVAPFDLDTPRKVSPETAAHIGLQTAEVDFGTVEEVIRLTGVVRPVPDRVRSVAARIDGTVMNVIPQVGDTVERGDLVAEIDSPQLSQYIYELHKLDAEYYGLQSELAQARSSIDELAVKLEAATEFASIADEQFARVKNSNGAVAENLLSEKRAAAVRAGSETRLTEIQLALSRQQLTSMTGQSEAMERSQAALRQVIASIRNDAERGGTLERMAEAGTVRLVYSGADDPATDHLGYVRLYAPISGVVITRQVNGGQGVEAGQTLMTIAEYSRVQIEGELPESLVFRLETASNNPVRIRRASDTDADPITTGTVRFISPVIDPIKRTTHVIIDADNSAGLLRDGLYVDLSIVLRQETSAVVVPASAVVVHGPMHFVFVKDGEFYKKQDIQPGYRDDQVVEVLSGVFPGDVIVTRGAYSLTQLRPTGGATETAEGSTEGEGAGEGDGEESGDDVKGDTSTSSG